MLSRVAILLIVGAIVVLSQGVWVGSAKAAYPCNPDWQGNRCTSAGNWCVEPGPGYTCAGPGTLYQPISNYCGARLYDTSDCPAGCTCGAYQPLTTSATCGINNCILVENCGSGLPTATPVPQPTATPPPGTYCNYGACGVNCPPGQRYVEGNGCPSWYQGAGCYVDTAQCSQPTAPPQPTTPPSCVYGDAQLNIQISDNGGTTWRNVKGQILTYPSGSTFRLRPSPLSTRTAAKGLCGALHGATTTTDTNGVLITVGSFYGGQAACPNSFVLWSYEYQPGTDGQTPISESCKVEATVNIGAPIPTPTPTPTPIVIPTATATPLPTMTLTPTVTPTPVPNQCQQITILRNGIQITAAQVLRGDQLIFRGRASGASVTHIRFTVTKGGVAQAPADVPVTTNAGEHTADLPVGPVEKTSYLVEIQPVTQ